MTDNMMGKVMDLEDSPEQNDDRGAGTIRISVCIVCRNEAGKLEPCLQSVQWADEVVVMDLSSTDHSAAIAEAYGARVISREPFPIVEPLRNELAAEARGMWILALDPDERVTPGLARELQQLARREDIDAVVTPRTNWDLGYPPSNPIQRYEPQIRMYRRSAVEWPAIPNALPRIPPDRLFRLPARDDMVIIHERSRSIPEILDRAIRYAPAQAQSMIDQGQVFTAKDMFIALASQAHKEFLRGQAWKDGVPGILRASILVAFKFYVWAAFWQLSGGHRTAADDRLIRRMGMIFEALRLFSSLCGAVYRLIQRLLAAFGKHRG